MAEVKKKATTKNTTNTSKVQKKSVKKREISQLSSDELMEQILAKKKSKTEANKKKDINNSVVKKTQSSTKSKVNELSSDELYDLIKAKKNKKKSTKISSEHKVEDKSLDVNDLKTKTKEKVVDKTKKDDLIITREITFTEDKLDLKDKKLLGQLRDAIEEFDSLDDTAPRNFDLVADKELEIVETKCVDKKKVINKYLFFLILLFLVLGVVFFIIFKKEDSEGNVLFKPTKPKEEYVDLKLEEYNKCLNEKYVGEELTGDILLAVEELNNYISKRYEASVMYEDLTLGFNYSYNTDIVYYAASTIKSLDALYIYTKAAAGELDLNETLVYSKKYKWSSSREMSKKKYGEKVSLRDLVKYAITVSDNSAHQMLIDYIGRKNLKSFGNSLGAKNTLVGADNFGSISTTDAIIYMKALNDFFSNNGELGVELKTYFLQADQNGLSFVDKKIEAAHKYGEYSYYYHDIGIVYDEHPYVIAILTHEGNDDFIEIIKDINSHIFELHNLYYSNRENVCHLEVYGN